MFSTIKAKFPGVCERCHRQFPKGTQVRWNGRACWHLSTDPGCIPASEATQVASLRDSGTVYTQPQALARRSEVDPKPLAYCTSTQGGAFCTRKAGHLGPHQDTGLAGSVTWREATPEELVEMDEAEMARRHRDDAEDAGELTPAPAPQPTLAPTSLPPVAPAPPATRNWDDVRF